MKNRCTNVPVYQSFRPMIGTQDEPMYQCTNHFGPGLVHRMFVPIMGRNHWYIGTLVHWVMGRPLFQSWAEIIGTLVHCYIGTLGHGSSFVPTMGRKHGYIGTLVLWFVAALALAVNPKQWCMYVCRVYVLYEKVELLPT